ncbi:MAG: DNA-3-methyladenine glycosylase I [Aeromicrobium sp.]|uniref:DNA-3-methyladenine glycosylase I n=1 Tax=Aeromicrobium sp. TaxID=1871063 RepID=UPI0039E28BC0
MDTLPGPDGLPRCPWGAAPDMTEYHDREWGRPVHGDAGLFERISLEAFQSGLSWAVILRKREAFRAAFCGFDPARVARFGPGDVGRLLADAGIVRNRAKIEATIVNAQAVLGLDGRLDEEVWSFAAAAGRLRPVRAADVPTVTTQSAALARRLRVLGFRFVGPTTAYALMQAAGLVDDHLAGCVTAPPQG